MMTIKELAEARESNLPDYNKAYAYYDSEARPRYLSRRLSQFFTKNPHYIQNWCALVVDAVRNKLIIEGFEVAAETEAAEGEEAPPNPRQDKLNEIWDTLGMAIEADSVHEHCHIVGEAFVVCGKDADGNPVAYAHDPRTVVVEYDGENPKKIVQAAKFWKDGDTHMVTVWELDGERVLEQTFEGSTDDSDVTAARNVSYNPIEEPQVTDYPRIPVFHFRRSDRVIKPEFYQITPLQDSINKAFVALGFSIENASNKMHVAITRSDISAMADMEPGDIMQVEPAPSDEQPVTFTTLESADFDKIGAQINTWVSAIVSITQSPRYYFTDVGTVSGEALQAFESPLISKVNRYIRRHSAQWEAWAAFMLELAGMTADTKDVTCEYADPRTTLTISQATSRATNVQAGIPITTQLRMEGWRESELKQLLVDRANEQPVEVSEQMIEQAYDQFTQRTERIIEPMLEQALTFIADAALNEVVKRMPKEAPAE